MLSIIRRSKDYFYYYSAYLNVFFIKHSVCRADLQTSGKITCSCKGPCFFSTKDFPQWDVKNHSSQELQRVTFCSMRPEECPSHGKMTSMWRTSSSSDASRAGSKSYVFAACGVCLVFDCATPLRRQIRTWSHVPSCTANNQAHKRWKW